MNKLLAALTVSVALLSTGAIAEINRSTTYTCKLFSVDNEPKESRYYPAGYGVVIDMGNSFVATFPALNITVSSGELDLKTTTGADAAVDGDISYRRHPSEPIYLVDYGKEKSGFLWDCRK